jgi:hypothetical protein
MDQILSFSKRICKTTIAFYFKQIGLGSGLSDLYADLDFNLAFLTAILVSIFRYYLIV